MQEFIHPDNNLPSSMGFSVMLCGAEKLVPAEYWCPYGTESLVREFLSFSLIQLFEV